MQVKPYHAELNRLRTLLDALANGDAEHQIMNRREDAYPVILNNSTGILNNSTGLVMCEDN